MNTLKLNQVKVENFRGIKELTLKLDGKSIVLEGANAAGKSSALSAISFLFCGEVLSGKTSNLMRLNASAMALEAQFSINNKVHVIKATQVADEKLYFWIDDVKLESKQKYLQMLAKILQVPSPEALLDIIHPIAVQDNIGSFRRESTKQLRGSFIRALNEKQRVFDNATYLKLKMEIDRKRETAKLLFKEYKAEKEYAAKFKVENHITDDAKDDNEASLKTRAELEKLEERFNKRETIKNRLLAVNSRISEIKLAADPSNENSYAQKFKRLTFRNVLLLIFTLGIYWHFLRRREKNYEDTRLTVRSINLDEMKRLEDDKKKLQGELDRSSADAKIDIEMVRNRLRELDSSRSTEAATRERWKLLLNDLKDNKDQIEKLKVEIDQLSMQKNVMDVALQTAAKSIFPKQWEITLFSDDNEEIFDIKQNEIGYENLNYGERMRIAAEVSRVLAHDTDLESFALIDHFESLSKFEPKYQIVAARVTNDDQLNMRKL